MASIRKRAVSTGLLPDRQARTSLPTWHQDN
jgi:hypothetical protein